MPIEPFTLREASLCLSPPATLAFSCKEPQANPTRHRQLHLLDPSASSTHDRPRLARNPQEAASLPPRRPTSHNLPAASDLGPIRPEPPDGRDPLGRPVRLWPRVPGGAGAGLEFDERGNGGEFRKVAGVPQGVCEDGTGVAVYVS